MDNYLVRECGDDNIIFGVIQLKSKEDWFKAKEYVEKCRAEDGRNFESDSELIEEYFEKNNVKYRWISIDGELEL